MKRLRSVFTERFFEKIDGNCSLPYGKSGNGKNGWLFLEKFGKSKKKSRNFGRSLQLEIEYFFTFPFLSSVTTPSASTEGVV